MGPCGTPPLMTTRGDPKMILNVSYRTDVPAFFWPWWSRRLTDGFVDVRNPYYPEKVSRLPINDTDIDAISYISKDFSHALTARLSLKDAARMLNTHATVTVNSYDSDIEPNVIRPWARRLEMVRATSEAIGRERLTWNYNPILVAPRYPIEHHLRILPRMFADIAPLVSRFSFDFVNMYPKVEKNAPEVRTPNQTERAMVCDLIDELLERYQLACATCDPARTRRNIVAGTCQSLGSLLEGSGRDVSPRVSHKTLSDCAICGHMAHRDVATYDTCPHACRYCYANTDYDAVARHMARYDQTSTMLCDGIRPGDDVTSPTITRYSRPNSVHDYAE